MNCPRCSFPNNDYATTCARCGQPLARLQPMPQPQNYSNAPYGVYGAPPVVVAQPSPPGKGMATAGMVLGIINYVFGFLTIIMPILGFIFSCVGLSSLNKAGSTDGKGMAVAGIVLNAIVLVGYVVFLLLVIILPILGIRALGVLGSM